MPSRYLNTPACGRLIRRGFAPHELPSLVEEIFSSKDAGDAVRSLIGDDVQTFIDVIDEARRTFAHANLLIGIDIDMSYRPGAGHARSFAEDPKEMSQIIV